MGTSLLLVYDSDFQPTLTMAQSSPPGCVSVSVSLSVSLSLSISLSLFHMASLMTYMVYLIYGASHMRDGLSHIRYLLYVVPLILEMVYLIYDASHMRDGLSHIWDLLYMVPLISYGRQARGTEDADRIMDDRLCPLYSAP